MPLVLGLNQNCEVKIKVDTASVLNMGEKSRTEHILFCCRSFTVEVACRGLTVKLLQELSQSKLPAGAAALHCSSRSPISPHPPPPSPPLPLPCSPQPNPASSPLLPDPKVLTQGGRGAFIIEVGSTTLNVGPILPGLCVKCVVLQKLAGTHRKR